MNNSISKIYVPPIGPDNAQVLIIGEAPGFNEEKERTPFCGESGTLLDNIFGSLGVTRDSVRITNLCNYRPANNDFQYLIDSEELKKGINDITTYITKHRQTLKVIILCGERPLSYILNRYGISEWRGSPIIKDGLLYLPTYHPAYVLRNRELYPILSFDFAKAFQYCREGYRIPIHNFTIDPRGLELEDAVDEIISNDIISVDIEAVKNSTHILCVGFGLSKERAICIVNHSFEGNEPTFYSAVNRILSHRNKKIFQNGFGYDVNMFRENGILVENYYWDTMIAQHVLNPEFPRSLGFLTSLYTDEPYYKDRGRSSIPDNEKGWSAKEDKMTLYEYNCIDDIATYQVYEKQLNEINSNPNFKSTFDHEMEMIPIALHLAETGMPIDDERRKLLLEIVNKKYVEDQIMLNTLAGYNINVKSTPQLKKLLYKELSLPERSNQGKTTADEDAIVSLLSVVKDKVKSLRDPKAIYEWQKKFAVLKLILSIRGYRQLKSNYLEIEIHPDQRIHSTYDITATETGRWAGKKYVDGIGLNPQTIPRTKIDYVSPTSKD